jgi:UDP-2,3-diacylglucosamine hydrolase
MDVNQAAVLQGLTLHRCNRLIHGHTHRPAHHRFELDGRPCERWVLPDWYENGGYLACDDVGCRLHDWPP